MSTSGETYFEKMHRQENGVYWLDEALQMAANVYGRRNGVNAGIAEAQTHREGYTGYVLENADFNSPIVGFELGVSEGDDWTAILMRPEERNRDYESYRRALGDVLDEKVE